MDKYTNVLFLFSSRIPNLSKAIVETRFTKDRRTIWCTNLFSMATDSGSAGVLALHRSGLGSSSTPSLNSRNGRRGVYLDSYITVQCECRVVRQPNTTDIRLSHLCIGIDVNRPFDAWTRFDSGLDQGRFCCSMLYFDRHLFLACILLASDAARTRMALSTSNSVSTAKIGKLVMNEIQDAVAVVIVTHNGEKYLTKQLESLLPQLRASDCLYHIDDNSTDNSCRLVLTAAKEHSVKTISMRGVRCRDTVTRIGRNFYKGAVAASRDAYDVVMFSDQDDFWEPERRSRQFQRLVSTKALMTCGRSRLFEVLGDRGASHRFLSDTFPSGVEKWSEVSQDAQLELTIRYPSVTGAASAIHTDILRLAPKIPYGWLHDRWLAVVAAGQGRLDHDDALVLNYRIHENQTVGTSSRGGRERLAGTLMSAKKLIDYRTTLARTLPESRRREVNPWHLVRF